MKKWRKSGEERERLGKKSGGKELIELKKVQSQRVGKKSGDEDQSQRVGKKD